MAKKTGPARGTSARKAASTRGDQRQDTRDRDMRASPATRSGGRTGGRTGGRAGGRTAQKTTTQYRTIQRETDQREQQRQKQQQGKQQGKQQGGAKQGGQGQQKAAQAGPRAEPAPPMPRQHLEKPGLESDVNPRPRYLAPGYEGSNKLRDMVAIITGGDSGIGRSVAVLYAREGADVAIIYLPVEQSDAEETRQAVEKEGRRCLLIPGDVSSWEFCQRAVQQTIDELGKLDILVNNAAFQEHAESIDELTIEHFDRTMKTNLYGYFYMAKAALPHLHQGSAIINTGSVTGLHGAKQLLDYSMTKGGIHAFTKSLSENVIDKGIRVNAVAPGPVWTPLNPADAPPDKVAKFGSDVPMGRPAQPEELSPLYVFLAAPSCSSYITGAVYEVIGGEQSS
jgi:NAD(P)-dependent dehydrogenase (short-subunit alcohol dehydrogenase family)